MKAGILYNTNDIRVGEAPDPTIGPDEILLESRFAGICGTDLHIYRGEFGDRVKFPAIQGHEFGGIILEIGSQVTKFHPGDRVAIDPIISCHSCPACLSGHINACSSLKLLGVDLDGGYGQYLAAPQNRVFHLPDNVPMQHAPMVEMYALGHHILQRGKVQPGETVALLGAGRLGLSILDVLCHSSGANTVIVVDLHPFRLETARKLGADYTIDLHQDDAIALVKEITGGEGVDCVIEAVGHYHLVGDQEAPLAQAVHMVRNGGRIVTTGLGEQNSSVYFKSLVIKEAQIIASRVTRGEFPRALHLMEKGLLHPELLITDQLPMSDIQAAFHKVDQENPETIKIVLDVQQI